MFSIKYVGLGILVSVLLLPRVTPSNVQDGSELEFILSQMGTKTGYKWIRKNLTDQEKEDFAASATVPRFCVPVQINAVLRHGSRYPSKNNYHTMTTVVNSIKSHINSPEFKDAISKWKPSYDIDQVKMLTNNGAREMKGLGKRYFTKFKRLFSFEEYEDLPSSQIKFITSSHTRAMESGHFFMKGMKEALRLKDDLRSELDDDLLRFYDKCDLYTVRVEDNKTALNEYHKYVNGPELKRLAEKIAGKLQLDPKYFEKEYGTILWNIFVSCGDDAAMNRDSIWCKLIDEEDVKLLEYRSDIKQYWRHSYPYEISYMQSCPLLKDIILNLDMGVIGASTKRAFGPKAVLRFGHAETMFPLYTLLGLFEDHQELLADNLEDMADRKFRASKTTPFSANILFTLYNCDTNERPSKEMAEKYDWPAKMDKFMIELHVNEKRVKFPFCQHHLCPYSVIKNQYSEIVDNCNFKKICKDKETDDDLDLIRDEL